MTADTVGGVFTHAVDLCAGLSAAGVDVVLVTFGRLMSPEQRARVAGAGVSEVHETDLALEWMDEPWADLAAAEELMLELVSRHRPDVVHLNGYALGAAPFPVPTLVAGHSCVCSWWEAVHGDQPPPSWDRYRSAVGAGLAAADAVVAPSATMLAALRRWYGPLPARALAIPNGSSYAGPAAPAGKRAVIVAAGRLWDEAKNVRALLAVAARPALRGRILIAGEGAPDDGADGVEVLGQLAPGALAEVRRGAAVFAAPARYEPFGLGILEAARDRCALVLGDIPSLREIWEDAAVYVDPTDDEALARALELLLADPVRTARLGERAHRRGNLYSVPAMTRAYRGMYDRLAAEAGQVAA